MKAPTVVETFFDNFPRGGKFLIVTHNHPDPDCISSAAALARISEVLGHAKTTIAYGGMIGRAENSHMVKYLKLKLVPLDQVNISSFDAVALVDTQPKTGNNPLPSSIIPDLVIDHHPITLPSKKVPHLDIRVGYGATASILTEYMYEFGLDVDPMLATALLYAIKSETQDLSRGTYPIDIDCYVKLFPLANKKLLSKIIKSKVTRNYFYYLSKAIDNAEVVGNSVVTRLDEVENADLIPEVADLLLRLEGASWAFSMGVYQEAIYLSIRTTNVQKNAGRLMKLLVKDKGTGGGHMLIAGGRIDVKQSSPWEVHALMDELEANFLKKVQKTGSGRVPLALSEDQRNKLRRS